MNYTKPELVHGGSAIFAVQGNDKPLMPVAADNQKPHDITATLNAYEADE